MPRPSLSGRAWRSAATDRIAGEEFDVLVVGGGITGAGIARDAVLRGLRVALVERDDFASGTSSRSSRLIHGGVRYLEHGYLHLVFEASRERRTLLRIAPHLVRPLRFTWPVYRGAKLPRWKVRGALWLYDLLSLFRNVHPHRGLSRGGVLEAEPMLNATGLVGGATYFDAATIDSALTLANVVDAASLGACVLNHVEVVALIREGDRVCGARVVDRLSEREIGVRARVVVNATGPWTDTVRQLEGAHRGSAVRGTKGVHVAVPSARLGNRAAVTVISAVDGRVMFVLPGERYSVIGTTDTETAMSPDEVRATRADVQYLLDSANAYFPEAALTTADVLTAWAGIRPLIAQGNTGTPASASREHAIVTGPGGVIQVTGGKLTTYRAMAAQVTDAVERSLGRRHTRCITGDRALPEIGEEFACSIADVLIRRTRSAFGTADHAIAEAAGVAERLAALFDWDRARTSRALEDYRAEIARLFTIDP